MIFFSYTARIHENCNKKNVKMWYKHQKQQQHHHLEQQPEKHEHQGS